MLHIESIFLSIKTFMGLVLVVCCFIPHMTVFLLPFYIARARKSLEDTKLSKILFLTPRCLTVKGGIVSTEAPTGGERPRLTR